MKQSVYAGQQFGYWTVIENVSGSKSLCKCVCGTVKEQFNKNLLNGSTTSCGCKRKKARNLDGQRFGKLLVLETHGAKCIVRCDCGTVKEVWKKGLLDGTIKTCASKDCKLHYTDLKGKRFGEWTAIEHLGNANWRCICTCGNEGIVNKKALEEGISRSCGCKLKDNRNSTVIQLYGDIGSKIVHNPREKWQIEVLSSKANLESYLKSLDDKPSVKALSIKLDSSEAVVGMYINQYGLRDYINYGCQKSVAEEEVHQYIKSIYKGDIVTNTRKIISPYELDIYIPDKKLAIEFNGNFWHSTLNKDRLYHQEKTIACAKRGIRLIHIFEYEWENVQMQKGIRSILKQAIGKADNVIYARNTFVCIPDINEVKEFENRYHLQGYATDNIHIALAYNNEIIGLMTFGKPRFSSEYQYELIRLCYKHNTIIVGGTEKLFKYFIEKYKPDNILSYVDISKFSGNSYIKLGFKPMDNAITQPGYIWVDKYNNVMSRYQTMKKKLVEKGWGVQDQTEDTIMTNNGYFKVYDSGNLKLVWTSH